MLDLLETDGKDLYFTDPLSPAVEALMETASEAYAEGDAELPLLRAYVLSEQHLTVLVGLYRFYYYQHRLDEARIMAKQAMAKAAITLNIPTDWRDLSSDNLMEETNKETSITLVRFYLLALKGWGYLSLRLGEFEDGICALKKVFELDAKDQLGAKILLDTVITSDEYRNFLRKKNLPIPLRAY